MTTHTEPLFHVVPFFLFLALILHHEQSTYIVQAPTTCTGLSHLVTLSTRWEQLPCSVLPLAVELNCSLEEEMERGRGRKRVEIFVRGIKNSDLSPSNNGLLDLSYGISFILFYFFLRLHLFI